MRCLMHKRDRSVSTAVAFPLGAGHTWARAAGVLRGLVRAVVTVEVSVTLQVTLDQAAAVGTAELVRTTGAVLWRSEGGKERADGRGGAEAQREGQRGVGYSRGSTPNLASTRTCQGSRETHHTPETRRSRRCSPCRGRTQSAWGCTLGSGT